MIIEYNRQEVIKYAKKWAYLRNDKYYNFDALGGDCTNFASQCICAGSNVMNFTEIFGWYYKSLNDRSPAWSGVEFLLQFLLNNNGANTFVGNGKGPFAYEVSLLDALIGDVIFLNNGSKFYHTLIIVGFEDKIPLVASHSYDVYGRQLTSYSYKNYKVLHIAGIRV